MLRQAQQDSLLNFYSGFINDGQVALAFSPAPGPYSLGERSWTLTAMWLASRVAVAPLSQWGVNARATCILMLKLL